MTTDTYSPLHGDLSSPARRGYPITPSDASELATLPRAIWVSGAGTLRLRLVEGDDFTITVPAGVLLPLRASQVYATGTTATGLVGLE